jgi:hypothetical protein
MNLEEAATAADVHLAEVPSSLLTVVRKMAG